MAHRQFYLTPAGAGFYRTRMLSAGDPILLSGPESRLQMKLGNVEATKPRARAAIGRPAGPSVTTGSGNAVLDTSKPAPPPVADDRYASTTLPVAEPAPRRRGRKAKK